MRSVCVYMYVQRVFRSSVFTMRLVYIYNLTNYFVLPVFNKCINNLSIAFYFYLYRYTDMSFARSILLHHVVLVFPLPVAKRDMINVENIRCCSCRRNR